MATFKPFSCNLLLLFMILIGVNESILSQNSDTKTKHIVEIKGMKFIPSELTVQKGDTVIWINRDIFWHDVTDLKNKTWTSSTLKQGKSWSKIITKNIDYYCSLHVVMKGKIIVKKKG